ncbi:hypothetical protein B0H14DRAFT_2579637 [Mycena olivaceomarginata]|nr:hypothetical protein B0H14DRAFT_2579637 [Mycena olivaceomarginata]
MSPPTVQYCVRSFSYLSSPHLLAGFIVQPHHPATTVAGVLPSTVPGRRRTFKRRSSRDACKEVTGLIFTACAVLSWRKRPLACPPRTSCRCREFVRYVTLFVLAVAGDKPPLPQFRQLLLLLVRGTSRRPFPWSRLLVLPTLDNWTTGATDFEGK